MVQCLDVVINSGGPRLIGRSAAAATVAPTALTRPPPICAAATGPTQVYKQRDDDDDNNNRNVYTVYSHFQYIHKMCVCGTRLRGDVEAKGT